MVEIVKKLGMTGGRKRSDIDKVHDEARCSKPGERVC